MTDAIDPGRGLQEQVIEALGPNPTIDPASEIERRVNFLVEYALAVPGVRGFVLGISGGQDSTLAGRLAQLAVDRLRTRGLEAQFVALRLPYGTQQDAEDADLAIDFIQPDREVTIQIQPSVDAMSREIIAATGEPMSDFNKGNIKARARMIAQYAVAGDRQLLVIGTDHAAEAVTGFFTKFGDGAADVIPLAGLTKSQGRQLLQSLNAPERLWNKVPTADLLDDRPLETDEASLGVSYEHIDAYLSGEDIPSTSRENLESKYWATRHKRHLPVRPTDEWWKHE